MDYIKRLFKTIPGLRSGKKLHAAVAAFIYFFLTSVYAANIVVSSSSIRKILPSLVVLAIIILLINTKDFTQKLPGRIKTSWKIVAIAIVLYLLILMALLTWFTILIIPLIRQMTTKAFFFAIFLSLTFAALVLILLSLKGKGYLLKIKEYYEKL